jgi:hypothetical protein
LLVVVPAVCMRGRARRCNLPPPPPPPPPSVSKGKETCPRSVADDHNINLTVYVCVCCPAARRLPGARAGKGNSNF